MKIIQRLVERFHQLADDRHTDDHRSRDEAVIDLMYLVMLADHRLSADERALVEGFVDSRPWSGAESVRSVAAAKARGALGVPANLEILVGSICDRIPSADDRLFALEAVEELASIDGVLSVEERDIIASVRARVGG